MSVNWRLFLIILFLLGGYGLFYITGWIIGQKNSDAQTSFETCGQQFDIKADGKFYWVDCGLYKTDSTKYFLIGRLLAVKRVKDQLLIKVDLGNLGRGRLLTLGKVDESYLWVTKMKSYSLYHNDNNFIIDPKLVNSDLESRLIRETGNIVGIAINRDKRIQTLQIDKVPSTYRRSVLFSLQNNQNCIDLLQMNLDFRKTNRRCPYFLVNNIWLFADE